MLSITKTPTREDLFLDLGTLETQCDVGAVLQTNKQEEKFWINKSIYTLICPKSEIAQIKYSIFPHFPILIFPHFLISTLNCISWSSIVHNGQRSSHWHYLITKDNTFHNLCRSASGFTLDIYENDYDSYDDDADDFCTWWRWYLHNSNDDDDDDE